MSNNNEINWDNGRLITLHEKKTAVCNGGLNSGQLYGLFFYNSANHDADTEVSVVWSNSQPPITITVPGTAKKEGLAAICFVSGSDTNTVSAAITNGNSGADLQAFICSVKMPIDTVGIMNEELPLDGNAHAFTKFKRFYAVPPSHWFKCSIESNINQFISVQFKEDSATVYIVNKLSDPGNTIGYAGKTKNQVTVKSTSKELIAHDFQGNGEQLVWINADSAQNSNSASISVQNL